MLNKKCFSIILINMFFLVSTIITDILYLELGNAYVFKTIASVNFVLCALINLILIFAFKFTTNKKFIIFLFIGQIFACLGDILLIDYFMIGAILFAIGHIFYLVSFYFLKPFKWTDLAFIFGTVAISLIVIFASGINLGNMLPLVIAYAVVISCMLGKSFTLFRLDKNIGTIITFGTVLFFLSDMFLMFNVFGGMGGVFDVLCLATYYPAEYFLAISISVVTLCLNFKKRTDKN
ncbi:MAG: lysoplasmalogenase [Clostridiales bacterium]|nr:lysoplasmalogenase [Clostridiales bacterium]